MEYNKGPQWFWSGVVGIWGFFERYGWFVVAALVAIRLLYPLLQDFLLSLKTSPRTDPTRLAQLEARRKEVVQRQQEAVDMGKEAFLKKKAGQEEEQRHVKIIELNAKAARLGITLRGKGEKLGSEISQEDEALYS